MNVSIACVAVSARVGRASVHAFPQCIHESMYLLLEYNVWEKLFCRIVEVCFIYL